MDWKKRPKEALDSRGWFIGICRRLKNEMSDVWRMVVIAAIMDPKNIDDDELSYFINNTTLPDDVLLEMALFCDTHN